MKKYFFFLAVLAYQDCFPMKGNASDGSIAAFAVILLLMLPIAVSYSITFIKQSIHSFLERKKHVEHE
jgi:hypothetical protein